MKEKRGVLPAGGVEGGMFLAYIQSCFSLKVFSFFRVDAVFRIFFFFLFCFSCFFSSLFLPTVLPAKRIAVTFFGVPGDAKRE